MPSNRVGDFGFAPAHDVPIPYMQRVQTYYEALGYSPPYQWAHYAEVPFEPLSKPLNRCRLVLITSSSPYQSNKGD